VYVCVAQVGLRTLAVAVKVLSPEEYKAVDHSLSEARTALQDRERKVHP
jgi:hypothetical protein